MQCIYFDERNMLRILALAAWKLKSRQIDAMAIHSAWLVALCSPCSLLYCLLLSYRFGRNDRIALFRCERSPDEVDWLPFLCGRPAVNHMMLRYLTAMNWMCIPADESTVKDSMSEIFWAMPSLKNENKWNIGNWRIDVDPWEILASKRKECGLRRLN